MCGHESKSHNRANSTLGAKTAAVKLLVHGGPVNRDLFLFLLFFFSAPFFTPSPFWFVVSSGRLSAHWQWSEDE
jgi:hypothetical protein